MHNRIKRFSIMLAAVLTAGVIYYFITKTGIFIPCLIYKITGFYCPGCGVTRMCIKIANLDFYGAFRSNPAVFLIAPILIFLLAERQYEIIRFGKANQKKWMTAIEVVLIIILIAFGILRNIPVFSFLQPQ